MKGLILIFGFTLVLLSCGGHHNSNDFDSNWIISEDSLVIIIKDMHIMDAAAKQSLAPSNTNNLAKYEQYKAVFEKHQVSKSRFDSTITLYTQHGKKFDALYDLVIERLQQEEKAQTPK